eukprot:PhM_4_TR6219/c0_g1_i3/m.26346
MAGAVEIGQLVGALQDEGHLDRAGPVGVQPAQAPRHLLDPVRRHTATAHAHVLDGLRRRQSAVHSHLQEGRGRVVQREPARDVVVVRRLRTSTRRLHDVAVMDALLDDQEAELCLRRKRRLDLGKLRILDGRQLAVADAVAVDHHAGTLAVLDDVGVDGLDKLVDRAATGGGGGGGGGRGLSLLGGGRGLLLGGSGGGDLLGEVGEHRLEVGLVDARVDVAEQVGVALLELLVRHEAEELLEQRAEDDVGGRHALAHEERADLELRVEGVEGALQGGHRLLLAGLVLLEVADDGADEDVHVGVDLVGSEVDPLVDLRGLVGAAAAVQGAGGIEAGDVAHDSVGLEEVAVLRLGHRHAAEGVAVQGVLGGLVVLAEVEGGRRHVDVGVLAGDEGLGDLVAAGVGEELHCRHLGIR